jgi:hypothetical protein
MAESPSVEDLHVKAANLRILAEQADDPVLAALYARYASNLAAIAAVANSDRRSASGINAASPDPTRTWY